ncbi:winged helix DNA-binding domain-containing protein [Leucobacter rhizosphaerae]|uniref:Winged helix DNA-binding domain-containing protein n=1 Tax=Leucobacter rhizosphaerae TaxID=2932245 RepID=A0ABY4FY18_9MICO|nr:winged helix DNA-binding domain-containing protein [Leucobacter rhizosphaerae]UOQ61205.1 winged helix DNA-binding domain-containing protein [Leucobacter rhizosphaerae]
MTEQLTPDDVLRLRMRALGLTADSWAAVPAGQAGPAEQAGATEAGSGTNESTGTGTGTDRVCADRGTGAERITAVARRMLAVQGQDWRSSRWALGVRAPGSRVDDVLEAFAQRRIVRSWPMRGTVHVVPAEDIGWMQAATNHRVLAGAPKRREFLGMSDAALDRLVETSLAAIDATPGLDRDALAAAWTDAGIEWQSAWRYHVVWWLCQNGLATFGPIGAGGEPQLVRAEGWIETPRQLDGDAALAELATRYAIGRGPVRDKDFAWWTGLTVREARVGIEAAAEAGALVRAEALDAAGDPVRGVAGALWVDPELLGSVSDRGDLPEWSLLTAFDEHLLGYTERAVQLDPEHFDRIVPGRNGMFLATVVHRGRVVGTWKRARTKHGGLEVTPFPGSRIDAAALAPLNTVAAEFHGVPPGEVTVAQA